MINFYDSDLSQILPGYLSKSPEVMAISYAISNQIKKLHSHSKNAMIYAAIDHLPEEALDLLAVELKTQYYDESLNVSNKRELIKKTLLWYSKAGTPEAVAELVQTVFGEGSVEEWYQYAGEPGYFKIKTNAVMTEDINDTINKMIGKVKNTRSHLETVEINRTIEQRLYFGMSQISVYKPAPITE